MMPVGCGHLPGCLSGPHHAGCVVSPLQTSGRRHGSRYEIGDARRKVWKHRHSPWSLGLPREVLAPGILPYPRLLSGDALDVTLEEPWVVHRLNLRRDGGGGSHARHHHRCQESHTKPAQTTRGREALRGSSPSGMTECPLRRHEALVPEVLPYPREALTAGAQT